MACRTHGSAPPSYCSSSWRSSPCGIILWRLCRYDNPDTTQHFHVKKSGTATLHVSHLSKDTKPHSSCNTPPTHISLPPADSCCSSCSYCTHCRHSDSRSASCLAIPSHGTAPASCSRSDTLCCCSLIKGSARAVSCLATLFNSSEEGWPLSSLPLSVVLPLWTQHCWLHLLLIPLPGSCCMILLNSSKCPQ